MGIPSFYRWLVERYPQSVVPADEESPTPIDGVNVPVDITRPNPNGIEYDNLYLDMNGIIHPCFHPEGLAAPKTNEEVFSAVFKYIDRVFSIIRPRKLLFLAIDGVAPRAKMNQQRTRRFRSAKEVADEVSTTERRQGVNEAEPIELGDEKLDSNVITPGTEFMEVLSSALQYYIHLRMNNDPGWQGIKVILSDASVPGEGEHKIVSYIRMQRNLPGFDPNTHHCLYGLDADLIMLALATHEIHFTILREDIQFASEKDRSLKSGINESGQSKQGEGFSGIFDNFLSKQKFQLLRIWILRDYLAHELRIPDPTVNADLERLIDDFVFMCLFVGNDFLPHVPSLEIREGAIDLLMTVYKKEFVHMGGYLTNSFEVNLERVGHFIRAVGSHETSIFRKRKQMEKKWDSRLHRSSAKSSVGGTKEIAKDVDVNSAVDKVKFGEEGCKERYYVEKFKVQTDADCDRTRKHAVAEYVKGMCWVMHYYYQGICSWQWYYPFYYAPFASDFEGLDQLEINFTLGKPFKPFDQLMGVLPAASAQALPVFYRKLMTDPSSPILDFYPTEFEVDLNGKRHAWQGVCKLPFIEEDRLLAEITKVEHTLTDEEKRRNSLGLDVLFVYESHPLAGEIIGFFERNKDNPKLLKGKVKKKIDPEFSEGMNGYMYISIKPVCPAEIHSPIADMEMIKRNKVIFVFYKLPAFHPHIPKLPEGVRMPKKIISKQDIRPPAIPWHEKTEIVKRRFSERPLPPKSVSGPYLVKLARQLVSETYIAMSRASENECGNKKMECDGSRYLSTSQMETLRIKGKKLDQNPNLLLIQKMIQNANGEREVSGLTKVQLAKSQAGDNQDGNVKMEESHLSKRQIRRIRQKLRHINSDQSGNGEGDGSDQTKVQLISETCVAKCQAGENQSGNGERDGSGLPKVQLDKSQGCEDQNGNGKSDGSHLSKGQKQRLRKKLRKINPDESGNGESDGSGQTKVQLTSESSAAKSVRASDNQNGIGEREGSELPKVQLVSETCVAKPQAGEKQSGNGKRDGSGLLKVQLAKSQACEDQNENGKREGSRLSKGQIKRQRIKLRKINPDQSVNGESDGSGQRKVQLVSETYAAKFVGTSENQNGNGEREGSELPNVQLVSETCVAKPQGSENQIGNGSGNGEREGSELTTDPLLSDTSVAKSGASENQIGNEGRKRKLGVIKRLTKTLNDIQSSVGEREGSELTSHQKKKLRVADYCTERLNKLQSSLGSLDSQVTGAPELE